MGGTCSTAADAQAASQRKSKTGRRKKVRHRRRKVEQDPYLHPLGPSTTSEVSPAPEILPPTATSQEDSQVVGVMNPLRNNQELDLFSLADIPSVRSSNVPSASLPTDSRAGSVGSTRLGVSGSALSTNTTHSCATRSSEVSGMFRPPAEDAEATPLRQADLQLLDQSSSFHSSSNVASSSSRQSLPSGIGSGAWPRNGMSGTMNSPES